MTHQRDANCFSSASLEERLFLYWDDCHIATADMRTLNEKLEPVIKAYVGKFGSLFQTPQLLLQQSTSISEGQEFSSVRALLHELDSPIGSPVIGAYMITSCSEQQKSRYWVNGLMESENPLVSEGWSSASMRAESVEEFIAEIEVIDLDIFTENITVTPPDNPEIPRKTCRQWEQEGCRIFAELDPCSWLYPGRKMTVTIFFNQADGTDGGRVTVISPIPYEKARISDFESMATVSLIDCECGRYKAFNPELYGTSREGRCEECFLLLASDW